jgi:GNAT superfamily N-acetyltransferase
MNVLLRPGQDLTLSIGSDATAQLYFREKFACLGKVEFPRKHSEDNHSDNNREVALELLEVAARIAAEQGQQTLIAPLDGDTWHSYRTIIEGSAAPKFFLEPASPLSAEVLEEAGFALTAQYSSSLIDLTYSKAAIEATIAKHEATIEKSFLVRHFNSANFEGELREIYVLSLKSFKNNFLYQAISYEDFVELYHPLVNLIKNELVWLAFNQGKLVGMLFALPDILNREQIILKTVAVDPDFTGLGIASYLLARVQKEALNLGFTSAVQALYKAENKSAQLTAGLTTKVIRRYGLFALDLRPQIKAGLK